MLYIIYNFRLIFAGNANCLFWKIQGQLMIRVLQT